MENDKFLELFYFGVKRNSNIDCIIIKIKIFISNYHWHNRDQHRQNRQVLFSALSMSQLQERNQT